MTAARTSRPDRRSTQNPEGEWLDLAGAVEYTKLGERTLRAALAAGDLKGYKPARGGKWLIKKSELDRWIVSTDFRNRRAA